MSKSVEIQYVVINKEQLEKKDFLLAIPKELILVADSLELKSISQLSTPSSMLIVATPSEHKTQFPPFSLYLDAIRNPGNFGTILRIADWYGIQQIFASKDCVEIYNQKVLQSSMGSFLRVQIENIDLEDLSKNGYSLWGATLDGISQKKILPSKTLLVIGNEGRGIRESYLNLLDHKVAISAQKSLGAESLNAAIATGILCDQLIG